MGLRSSEASSLGRLEVQLQGFAQVLQGFVFGSALARHVNFQALRHVRIFHSPYARGERLFHTRFPFFIHSAATDSNRPNSMERVLLVLDGFDDALAGCGAGREEAGEDTYEEA
jgi:hypothetical protein